MKKLLFVITMLFLVMLTSCDEVIMEARAEWETTALNVERDKIPFKINDYKLNGIEVESITIDTIVTTYHKETDVIPCWGYLKTTWTLKKFLGEDGYNFLYDDEIEKREILIELENCGYDGGHPSYTAKWPINPYNVIKQ